MILPPTNNYHSYFFFIWCRIFVQYLVCACVIHAMKYIYIVEWSDEADKCIKNVELIDIKILPIKIIDDIWAFALLNQNMENKWLNHVPYFE